MARTPVEPGRVRLTCSTCGTEYWQHRYRAMTSRFCSKACWSTRAPRRECERCATLYVPPIAASRFCSKSCAVETMVGPLSPRWKGGVSLKRDRARFSRELRKWRMAVLEVHGSRCAECGAEQDLHVHHIQAWSKRPDLRFDVSNGLVLCESCHSAAHGRRIGPGWKARRTVKIVMDLQRTG